MARKSRPSTPPPPEFPIGPDLWARVVRSLKLPPQHVRLVELLILGMKSKEIAAAMNLAEPTLKTYLDRMFTRLGVRDQKQLLVLVFSTALRLAERRHSEG